MSALRAGRADAGNAPAETVVQPPPRTRAVVNPFADGGPTVSMTPQTEQRPGSADATAPSAFTDAALIQVHQRSSRNLNRSRVRMAASF